MAEASARNDELLEEDVETTVSDSRARRKRNRGELVSETTTDKKGRPTPSRRKPARATESGLDNVPVIGGLVRYLRGVYAEMQKVTWPNREETINLTQVVLAVTSAFAIGLGLIDTFYTWWFRRALEDNTTLFLAIGAVVLAIAGTIVWLVFYRREDVVPY